MLLEKYQALTRREQKLLKITLPLALLLISWLLVIAPILETREKTAKSIVKHQKQLQWMRENATSVLANVNRGVTDKLPAPANKSQLRQVMHRLLKMHHIVIERIQNVNQQDVSYHLSNSQFNDILRLIESCQDNAIEIVQLQITKSKHLGKVNSRLTVASRDS